MMIWCKPSFILVFIYTIFYKITVHHIFLISAEYNFMNANSPLDSLNLRHVDWICVWHVGFKASFLCTNTHGLWNHTQRMATENMIQTLLDSAQQCLDITFRELGPPCLVSWMFEYHINLYIWKSVSIEVIDSLSIFTNLPA